MKCKDAGASLHLHFYLQNEWKTSGNCVMSMKNGTFTRERTQFGMNGNK
jgi:hypothetical protein